jgi:small-conductance mechanosensitive channel
MQRLRRHSHIAARIALGACIGACIGLLADSGAHAQAGGSAADQALAAPDQGAAAAAAAAAAAQALPDARQIIQFLDQTIGWYRDRAAEQQLATDPADMLALSDNRTTATQIVQLGFDFARAAAGVAGSSEKKPVQPGNAGQFQQLSQLHDRLDQQAQQLQGRLGAARGKLARAPAATRSTLQAQIAALQAEADLLRARRDAVGELLAFLAGDASGAGASGLAAQIETLAGSVAPENAAGRAGTPGGATPSAATAARPVAAAAAPTNGIWDLTAQLLSLSAKMDRIKQFTQQTDVLAQAAAGMRARLLGALRGDSSLADDLVNQVASTPIGQLPAEQGRLNALTAQFKSIASAMVPLAKLGVLLGQYHSELGNWRDNVHHQYAQTLRNLGIRIGAVAFILLLVIAASELWRRAVNRYVRDARRRYQFLLLRRFVLWFVIAIILASTLASRLDSFVTFAGLITAGIAVAMQSVILSVVGYFFLIGKYGIRAGDRVQIGDVRGEVIDVGLVRMQLMEYGRTGLAPTGRVVAFSNSIVFQATGGLFKQLPGVHFAWHEITVTFAHALDPTVIRGKLLAAVDTALGNYKDALDRQNREIERAAIALPGGALRASVQLRFSAADIQAAVRYPVDLRHAAQIDEAVSRELLKALEDASKSQSAQCGNPVPPRLELNTAPEG